MAQQGNNSIEIETISPSCTNLLFAARYGKLMAIAAAVAFAIAALAVWGLSWAGVLIALVAVPLWFVLACLAEMVALLVDTLVPR